MITAAGYRRYVDTLGKSAENAPIEKFTGTFSFIPESEHVKQTCRGGTAE